MTKKVLTIESEKRNIDGITLGEAVDEIAALIQRFGEDSTIDFTLDYEFDISFKVVSHRIETNEEYALRLERESNTESREKAYRRKQYEQLKKEFGDNNE